MIYKITTMSGNEIPLVDEKALADFLKEANSGKKLILTAYGVVNVASIDSIVPYKEKMEAVREIMGYGKSREEAEKEIFGDSPFAKLLAPKMAMLSPQSRTAAQEEAAKKERQK